MSNALHHALRGPGTWAAYRHHFEGVAVLVSCSKGHRSHLLHEVLPDGTLRAPAGKSPSLHCGVCAEQLPLRLDGWEDGAHIFEPDPLPPLSTCGGCGRQSHWIGGWGAIGGITGIACADCFQKRLHGL